MNHRDPWEPPPTKLPPATKPPAKPAVAQGSQFLSKAAAAERLGVTLRTVQNYHARRYLRAHHRWGLRGGVLREDVERLLVEGVPRSRPSDALRCRLLVRRICQVEARTAAVTAILDARRDPPELDTQDLMALADRAHHAALHGWDPGSEQDWLNLLCCLEEKHARRLARSRSGNPWSPFLFLATQIAFKLETDPRDFEVELSENTRLRTLAVFTKQILRGHFDLCSVKRGVDKALRRMLAEFTAEQAKQGSADEPEDPSTMSTRERSQSG